MAEDRKRLFQPDASDPPEEAGEKSYARKNLADGKPVVMTKGKIDADATGRLIGNNIVDKVDEDIDRRRGTKTSARKRSPLYDNPKSRKDDD